MQFGLRFVILVSFLFPITSSADNVPTTTSAACAEQLTTTALVKSDGSAPKFAGKVLIFDTNVIMNDPYSIYKYPGAKIIIPGAVMVEIDNHKKDPKTGRAVRTFSRIVSDLISKYKTVSKPAPLDEYGTTLMVDSKSYMEHLGLTSYDDPIPDNQIVATAVQYAYLEPIYENVFLVSDDINARVKASSVEVQVMGSDYEWVTIAADNEKEEQQIKRLHISQEDWVKFQATGNLALPQDSKLEPNDFAMLQVGDQETVPSTENVVRYVFDRETPAKSSLRKLLADIPPLPFEPKNLEQTLALDLLLDPTVDLVISESSAGTGKTFITMMAGLLQTRGGATGSRMLYDQMIVSRTLVHVGKTELGTLPGGVDSKLAPFNENYADAWAALNRKKADKKVGFNRGAELVSQRLENNHNGHISTKERYSNSHKRNRTNNNGNGGNKGGGQQAAKGGKPPYELLAFPNIRGRSINDSFIILDEAQNTSMHEMKTFLTRAGEGTKMVLLGDASQVDATFLNEYNNGLKIVSSLVKTANLSPEERSRIGTVKLTETVRSALAELAVKLFDSKKNE